MKKGNKIPMTRMILSFIIIFILIFPFYDLGIKFPTYLYNGNILIDFKYIIVGILFIIAEGINIYFEYTTKNKITDYGKLLEAMTSKLLIDSVLIVLACNGMISPIIAVVIISRDIIVDGIKMFISTKGEAMGTIKLSKIKNIILIIGITLTLFYNMPLEIVNINISDFLLVVAAILSVITGVKYYMMAKKYITVK